MTDARTYCSVSYATCFAKKLMFFEKSKLPVHWKKMLWFYQSQNLLLQMNHRQTDSVCTSLTEEMWCKWLVQLVACWSRQSTASQVVKTLFVLRAIFLEDPEVTFTQRQRDPKCFE